MLSDGHFYRVGGHNPLKANVRVIAATHQNLETRVKDGLFREDLFHRLNVIRLRLPALRERPEDITLLARHFLQKSAKELGVEPKRMSDEALSHIATLPFPGNVRQLENLCNWLTVMAPAQTIEIKDLPHDLVRGTSQMLPGTAELMAAGRAVAGEPSFGVDAHAAGAEAPVAAGAAAGASAVSGWERALAGEAKAMLEAGQPDVMDALTRRFERAILEAALGVTRGRRVEAATRLGIGRNTITRKLQELGFD